MMPGISGYDVCRRIRDNPATTLLPVVMCTSLDPQQERVKGIEAGADDFLSKPVNQAELFARVKSLLRIKALHDELGALNADLEKRVAAQVAEIERLARLKRFVSPRIGDLIVAGEVEDPLKTHRREITVVFTDLRGFTAFSETAEPEEVMEVLRQYHAAIGGIVLAHEGTIEHFAGDGVMILFNDPIPLAEHELAAVRMALQMRDAVGALGAGLEEERLRAGLRRRGRQRLRDARRDRLRGAARLRRDRSGHQSLGAPLRRGERGPGAGVAAGVRQDRGARRRPSTSAT